MSNIVNLFNLDGKTAYVLGGSGLIGAETIKLLDIYKAKVVNLDIQNYKKNQKTKNNKQIFEKFDCTKLEKAKEKLVKIFNKNNYPDIFINCSYPKTKNWKNNSFSKIDYKSLKKNIELHLNSSVWITKIVAEEMIKKKIRGSIIQTGSIYGLVGQDKNIYLNTKMNENMSYSIIKGGIINFTRYLSTYYARNNIRINAICPGGIFDKQPKKFVKN